MVCGNTRWRKESCGGEVAERGLPGARSKGEWSCVWKESQTWGWRRGWSEHVQRGRKILLRERVRVQDLDGLVLGGFGLCSALATQRARSAVLSAWLMWLQIACCECGGFAPWIEWSYAFFHPRSVSGRGCCSSSGKREVWADLLHQPEWQGEGRGKKPNTNKKLSVCSPKGEAGISSPTHTVTPR